MAATGRRAAHVPYSSLSPERHRDLVGRGREVWARRVGLTLIAVGLVLALLNLFGQRSEETRAAGAKATLSVSAPKRVRGGLLFQARITVRAHAEIAEPRLVLGRGWLDGLTLNTLQPSPPEELSRDGDLVLAYDRLHPGQQLVVWLQYQVNPTHVGSERQTLELDDGATPLAHLARDLVSLP